MSIPIRLSEGLSIMGVKYRTPLIAAVQHVFKTVLQTELMIGKARLKAPDASV